MGRVHLEVGHVMTRTAEKTCPVLEPRSCGSGLASLGDLEDRQVDISLLGNFNSCRRSVNIQLSVQRQSISEHVVSFTNGNEQVQSFKFECECLKHMAQSGRRGAVQQRILKDLPEKHKPKEPNELATSTDRLKNSTQLRYADLAPTPQRCPGSVPQFHALRKWRPALLEELRSLVVVCPNCPWWVAASQVGQQNRPFVVDHR